MNAVVHAVLSMAAQVWYVLVSGLLVVVSLVMLANTTKTAAAVGAGSGALAGDAIRGLLAPLVVVAFLFLAVPPLIRSMQSLSACGPVLGDLTQWAQDLLAVIIAFRMLKIGYQALIADALDSGYAVSMLLRETAAVVAAMLLIPFIGGVAAALLSCS